MSKPDGRRKRAIENLATALNECFEAAVEAGEDRTRAVLDETLGAQNKTLNKALDAQNETLNAQTETLRMIWQQCGGRPDQRLPIDK